MNPARNFISNGAKRSFLLTVFAFVTCAGLPGVFAGEIEDQFSKANQSYVEGQFDEAAAFYEKLIQSNVKSGPLYYNLGNAYFKLGRIGKAILNYERARRVMPQDEDLLSNLAYVKNLVEQAQPVEEHPLHEKAFLEVRDLFSESGWVLILLTMYTLIFVMWIFAIFSERLRKTTLGWSWCFILLTMAAAIFTSAKISETVTEREGIIVQNTADVRYSPSVTGAVAFQLKEGIRAQILRMDNDWCYIRLTRDKIGWIARSEIEAI